MELTKRILKNIQNPSEDHFVSLCEYIKSLQDEGKLEVKNPIEMFM